MARSSSPSPPSPTERLRGRFNPLRRLLPRSSRTPVLPPASLSLPRPSEMVVGAPTGRPVASNTADSTLVPGPELPVIPRTARVFGGLGGTPTRAGIRRERASYVEADDYHAFATSLRVPAHQTMTAREDDPAPEARSTASRLASLFPFSPPNFHRPLFSSRSMVNLGGGSRSPDRSPPVEMPLVQRPDFEQYRSPPLPQFLPAPPRQRRDNPNPTDQVGRVNEAYQNVDRGESANPRRISTSAELDMIQSYHGLQSSSISLPQSITAPALSGLSGSNVSRHDLAESRKKPDRYQTRTTRTTRQSPNISLTGPTTTEVASPQPSQSPSLKIKDRLFDEAEDAVDRLRSPQNALQRLSEAEDALGRLISAPYALQPPRQTESESLREMTQQLSRMAAEKAAMDVEVLELKRSHEEQKAAMDAKVLELERSHEEQTAHLLNSRVSPDPVATDVTIPSSIEDIPSDEEPEVGEAVSFKYCKPGTVKIVGKGPPMLDKTQREEKEKKEATAELDTLAKNKAIQLPEATKDALVDKTRYGHEELEPFPAFDNNIAQREHLRYRGLPRDESQAFAQTWVEQYDNVQERPESTRFDPYPLAERAFPPAPLHRDVNSPMRAPSHRHAYNSAMMQAHTLTPSRVPLPRSPSSPFDMTPMQANRLTPSHVPLPRSPFDSHTSPRMQANTLTPSRMPLPRSPNPPVDMAPMRFGSQPTSRQPSSPFPRSPLEHSMLAPPPGSLSSSVMPPMTMPDTVARDLPERSSSRRPHRQHCIQGGHVFRPRRLNNVPDNAMIGRMELSPYLETTTGARQHVDITVHCEKCDEAVKEYLQCKVPTCNLLVCRNCAREMRFETEKRRGDTRGDARGGARGDARGGARGDARGDARGYARRH